MHKAIKQARKSKLIRYDPFDSIDKPSAPAPAVQFLTAEQVARLLDVTRNDRLWPLYALAVSTGLRQGELLGLWWNDVNLGDQRLAVTHTLTRDKDGKLVRTEPKTASSRRQIQLPQLALAALKTHKRVLFEDGLRDEGRYRWVFSDKFGQPLLKDVLGRRFKRHMKAAGLPKMSFHALRHTAASLRIAQGVHPKVVQEMLGHSSITTTLDTYSRVVPSMQKESADRFDALFPATVMAH